MKKYLLVFVLIVGGLVNGFSQDSISVKIKDEYTIDEVEEMPGFPGGFKEMQLFIASNVTYPKLALKTGAKGKVLISFSVEKNGELKNISIIKSSCPTNIEIKPEIKLGYESIDNEGLRIVKLMPNWNPAKHKGQHVKIKSVVVPINFQFN
jgi:TonB family protein